MTNTNNNNAANTNNVRNRDSRRNVRRIVTASGPVALLSALRTLERDGVTFRLRTDHDDTVQVEFVRTTTVDPFDVTDDGACEERAEVVYHRFPATLDVASIRTFALRFIAGTTFDAAAFDAVHARELMAKRMERAPQPVTWKAHAAPILRAIGIAC